MERTLTSLGMNALATDIADGVAEQADAAPRAVHLLANGARVIDCGVNVPGGYDAGLALSEICMGGLGQHRAWPCRDRRRILARRDGLDRPSHGDLHGIAVRRLGHLARWVFRDGVRPDARACPRREGAVRQARLRGGRRSMACWCSKAASCPTAAVAAWVAAKARLRPEQLTFLVAPTASLAGGVQIAARVVETAMHKIERLHFDLSKIVSGVGTAPLPPVAKNDTPRHRTDQRLHPVRRERPLHRECQRRGTAALAPQVPASSSARLRHAVLRDLRALRQGLLQDRSAAVQPGRGALDEHRERTNLSTPGSSTPTCCARRAIPPDGGHPIPTQELDTCAVCQVPASSSPSCSRGLRADEGAARLPTPRPRRAGSGRPAGDRDGAVQVAQGHGHVREVLPDAPQDRGRSPAGDRLHQGGADEVRRRRSRARRPEFYRQAELYFPSMDAARAGMATAGFKAVGDDFKNFVAPDGLVGMVGEETGDAERDAVPRARHGDLRHADQTPPRSRRTIRSTSRSCRAEQTDDRVRAGRPHAGSSRISMARRRRSIARPSSASPAWSTQDRRRQRRRSPRSATTSATSSPAACAGMIGVQQ